jgi:thiol-disulfide isomerase/thioredoxin
MFSHFSKQVLAGMLALCAAYSFAAQDQPTSGTARYNMPVGTHMVYETSGTLKVTGDVEREQLAKFRYTFTVVDQQADARVLFAEVDAMPTRPEDMGNDKEPTYKPAARFTLSLPAEGAVPGQTVQTAGLAGSPFPGWKFESLFPPIPADGKTSASTVLDIVDDMADLQTTAKTQNDVTTIQSELSAPNPRGLQQYSYSATYAPSEFSVRDTSQSLLAAISPGNGMKALLSLSFESKRSEYSTLPKADVEQLSKDLAAAIPVATRMRSIAQSGDEAVQATLKGMEDYLAKFPNGKFAPLFSDISQQLAQMRAMNENAQKLAEGNPAPDFEGTTLDGKKLKLSALKGKVVLIDFWATWCGPCVSLIPEVKRIYETNQGKPFELIGISADHEIDALKRFVKDRDLKWPMIYEGEPTSGSAMLAYGIQKFPTTVLIDAQGQIRKVDAHGDELNDAIAELLREVK